MKLTARAPENWWLENYFPSLEGLFSERAVSFGDGKMLKKCQNAANIGCFGKMQFPHFHSWDMCVCLHVCVCVCVWEPHSVSKSMYETFVCVSLFGVLFLVFSLGGGARSSSKNSCWNQEAGGSSRVMQRPKSAMNEDTLEPLVKNSRINCVCLLTRVSTVAQAFILRCFSNLTSNQPYQVLFRIDLKPGVNQPSFFWFCAATTLDRV